MDSVVGGVCGVCGVCGLYDYWSKRFMQVILTNQIQAVNATSTEKLSPSCYYKLPLYAAIISCCYKLLQPAPSNIKPCNYKQDHRKCTEAGINSCITVPSKVHASQDPTKTE